MTQVTAPLVSLCVPTRNRARSLRQSLKSICGQDYSSIEILISDNCSEDDTEQVCREWMARDSRIRYVRHDRNIGLHGNHNFCFDEARGAFICICHDHDTRDAHIVSEYVSFLTQHPRVGIVCSDWDLIDDDDRRIGRSPRSRRPLAGSRANGPKRWTGSPRAMAGGRLCGARRRAGRAQRKYRATGGERRRSETKTYRPRNFGFATGRKPFDQCCFVPPQRGKRCYSFISCNTARSRPDTARFSSTQRDSALLQGF